MSLARAEGMLHLLEEAFQEPAGQVPVLRGRGGRGHSPEPVGSEQGETHTNPCQSQGDIWGVSGMSQSCSRPDLPGYTCP